MRAVRTSRRRRRGYRPTRPARFLSCTATDSLRRVSHRCVAQRPPLGDCVRPQAVARDLPYANANCRQRRFRLGCCRGLRPTARRVAVSRRTMPLSLCFLISNRATAISVATARTGRHRAQQTDNNSSTVVIYSVARACIAHDGCAPVSTSAPEPRHTAEPNRGDDYRRTRHIRIRVVIYSLVIVDAESLIERDVFTFALYTIYCPIKTIYKQT